MQKHTAYELTDKKDVTAGYTALAAIKWLHGSMDDYTEMIHELQRCFAEKSDLRVKIVVEVKEVIVAAPAPDASQPQGSQAPRPRNTAINRALAALPMQREELEATGNNATEITERWACRSRACINHGRGLCYYAGRDDASYHVPIISAVLTAWSEAIRDGECTAEEPRPQMIQNMFMAKREIEAGGSRRRQKTPQQSSQMSPGITLNIGAGASMPANISEAPPSSPFRVPSSSPQGSSIEQMDRLFQWCTEQAAFRGEDRALGLAKKALRDNSDDLETMAAASVEDWQAAGIAGGLRKRLRKAVRICKSSLS